MSQNVIPAPKRVVVPQAKNPVRQKHVVARVYYPWVIHPTLAGATAGSKNFLSFHHEDICQYHQHHPKYDFEGIRSHNPTISIRYL